MEITSEVSSRVILESENKMKFELNTSTLFDQFFLIFWDRGVCIKKRLGRGGWWCVQGHNIIGLAYPQSCKWLMSFLDRLFGRI
jgi:hypothetical protein